MFSKKIYALTLLSLTVATATAQDYVAAVRRHEISAYTFGGLSTLRYKSNYLKVSPGVGAGFGIGYALCFDERMAFVTGLEATRFRATASANMLSSGMSYKAKQVGLPNKDAYDMFLNGEFVNYRERQRVTYLQLPLMWQLTVPFTTPLYRFYVAGGTKFGFSLGGKIETDADALTTSAYFPTYDMTFYNRPKHLLTTRKVDGAEGSFTLSYDVMLSVEVGLRRTLRENWEIAVGLYFDYGYIDVPNRNYDGLVCYNSDMSDLVFNSVLEAKYSRMTSSDSRPTFDSYVKRASVLATGLKIKILFGRVPRLHLFLKPMPVEGAE